MRIEGTVFFAVLQDNGLAIAAINAYKNNLTIAGGFNECALGGGIINSSVSADPI